MRNSSQHSIPRLDWLVLAVTIGISLAFLFWGRDPAAVGIKRDIGGAVGVLAKPVMLTLRTFDLWRENAVLRDQATRLGDENSKLRAAAIENLRLRAMLQFRERFPHRLIAADVIGFPGASVGGRILINAGRADGVQLNAPVVTPNGLVGKIVELGSQSSLVQSLVGNAFGVSAFDERSRVAGILRWTGPGEWTLVGLSTGDDVKPGDLILTTGAGYVFPKNIRVGIVSRIDVPTESSAGWCRVQPFVRFNTVEEVFIIRAGDPNSAEADSMMQAEAMP